MTFISSLSHRLSFHDIFLPLMHSATQPSLARPTLHQLYSCARAALHVAQWWLSRADVQGTDPAVAIAAKQGNVTNMCV